MTTRTDSSITNQVTWTDTSVLTNENILLDVNWDNVLDVNGEQILVIWGLVPPITTRTDAFTPNNTVRS